MGLRNRFRNGKVNDTHSRPSPSASSSNTPEPATNKASVQVPVDQRHERLIVVPQVPLEITHLLVALGAEPLSSALKGSDTSNHYRLFELPENMAISGRYTRADEFTDGTNPIHGWYAGTVYAPDHTLLFSVNDLNGMSTKIGRAWEKVANMLGLTADKIELPDSVIFPNGESFDEHHGTNLQKLANGIVQEGMFHVEHVVATAFARLVGHHRDTCEFKDAFKRHLDEIEQSLVDLDDSRALAFKGFLQERNLFTPEIQALVSAKQPALEL